MSQLTNWSLDTLSLVSLVVAGTVLGLCVGGIFVLNLDQVEGFRDIGLLLNGALAGGALGLLGAGASFLRLERPQRLRFALAAAAVALAAALLTIAVVTFLRSR